MAQDGARHVFMCPPDREAKQKGGRGGDTGSEHSCSNGRPLHSSLSVQGRSSFTGPWCEQRTRLTLGVRGASGEKRKAIPSFAVPGCSHPMAAHYSRARRGLISSASQIAAGVIAPCSKTQPVATLIGYTRSCSNSALLWHHYLLPFIYSLSQSLSPACHRRSDA